MKLTPNMVKAIEDGLALVLYQDDQGVHVGLLDRDAVVEVRERKITAEEAAEDGDEGAEGASFWAGGFMDTDGGSVNTKVDFSPIWDQLAGMFVGDEMIP